MKIDRTLESIFSFSDGADFISFANSEGKRWIMPICNMRIAMSLYQPSSIKGKLVKKILPVLYWNPFIRNLLHTESLKMSFSFDFLSLLNRFFCRKNLDFSVFCGTPSARQKITIQISDKECILGYCKVTKSLDVYELFKKESCTLERLNKIGMLNIPKPLFCGEVLGVYLFIQSTQKTKNSKILHKWTDKHTNFLKNLHIRTIKNVDFRETDFYASLKYFESVLYLQNCNDRLVFEQAIQILNNYYDKIKEYSFLHGDFTPWNMFVENENLCVFDFEYSQNTYPPYLDKVHYFLQIWILEEHLNAEQIFVRLENLHKKNQFNVIQIISYLMYILSFYFKLYDGKFDSKDNGYIIWTELLRKYINIYE